MGLYRQHVLPRLINKMMDTKLDRETRARVCGGLHGEVVELGFGSGLNVAHYPSAVTTVHAVEPSELAMRLAEPRIAASAVTVAPAGLTGEHLDLPTAEFDAVLSTWTLCTIPDVDSALDETRRVLKPDGQLHFVEHGHAPDPAVARWQGRIEPLNKRLLGGCHLTRRIAETIERAGFTVEQLDAYYSKSTPRVFGYTFEGRARKR